MLPLLYLSMSPAFAGDVPKGTPVNPSGVPKTKVGEAKGSTKDLLPVGEGAGSVPEETRPAETAREQALKGYPDSLEALWNARAYRTLSGNAQGAPIFDAQAAVTETAQILGQIVVTRAQQAAYERITKDLKTWLLCGDAGAPFPFTKTCAAIETLRLEDIATQPESLVDALVTDVLVQVLPAGALPADTLAPFLRAVVTELVSASLERRSGAALTIAPMVAQQLLAQGGKAFEASQLATNVRTGQERTIEGKSQQLYLVAGSALAMCENVAVQAEDGKVCDVPTHARWAAEKLGVADDPTLLVRATSLAGNAWLATTWSPLGIPAEEVADARIGYALEAAFDATCWGIDYENGCAPLPADLAGAPSESQLASAWIAFVRPIAEAAVARDTNALITAIGSELDTAITLVRYTASAVETPAPPGGDAKGKKKDEKALTPEQARAYARAFGILGTLGSYAGTYFVAGTDGALDAAALHDQRTALLESLVESYTSRRGREGDWIPSLAGSLDMRLGGRIPLDGATSTFDTPIGLPIGFGLHGVPEKDGATGFLLQVGIVDLGQYVSWRAEDGGLVVDEPEWLDLFAPSVSVGAAWGKQAPFSLSAYGSLSPTYDGDDALDGFGSFSVGVRAGVYVPLLDLN